MAPTLSSAKSSLKREPGSGGRFAAGASSADRAWARPSAEMTEGGPAYDTTMLVVYVYRLAFTEFNVGYASAVGAVWLVVLIVFAALFVRATAARTDVA